MAQLRESPLPNLLYRSIVVVALVAALAGALTALAPDQWLREAFVMVDRDDSRHELEPAHRHGLRAIGAFGAAAFAIAALVLVRRRERALRGINGALGEFTDFSRRLRREAPPPAGAAFWTLIAVCALGTALRLSWLNSPMRFDEADTYNFFASRNVFSLISDYTAPNNHILHTLLVHYATALFGSSPAVIRLPAFLAGVVVMPLTYAAARRFGDEAGALTATGLVAASPLLVRYSTEARGYTIVTVCFLGLCLIAPYLVERRSVALWALFGLLTTAGGLTIPVMLYPVAVVSVWMLISARPERRLPLARELAACGAVSAAAALALYAPAVGRSGWRSLLANQWVAPFTWPFFVEKMQEETRDYWAWMTIWIPNWFVALMAAGVGFGLIRRRVRALVAAALVTIGLLMLAQRVVPFARVFTFAAPALLIVVGWGWSAALRRGLGAPRALRVSAPLALALTIFLGWRVGTGAIATPPEGMRQSRQAHQAALRILPDFGPEQAILSHPTVSDPVRYYLLRAGYSRAQVIVFDELHHPDQLKRYARIWVVKRREQSMPSEASYKAPDREFGEPKLEFETELIEVYSLLGSGGD